MNGGVILPEVDLDELFCIVPGTARVSHVHRLKEPEDRDGHEVGDEEIRVEKGESKREREKTEKNVPHPLLGLLGTDPNNGDRILPLGLLQIKIHVLLDVLDGKVGPGGDSMNRSNE